MAHLRRVREGNHLAAHQVKVDGLIAVSVGILPGAARILQLQIVQAKFGSLTRPELLHLHLDSILLGLEVAQVCLNALLKQQLALLLAHLLDIFCRVLLAHS